MFWFFSFLVVGGAYLAVDALAGIVLFAIAAAVVVVPVVLGITWLSEHTAIYHPMIASWEWLSGWHVGENIADVPDPDPNASTYVLFLGIIVGMVMIIVAICNVPVALAATIATPVGAVITVFGALAFLLTRGRTREPLQLGLGVTTLGVGATVLAGVVMRIIHLLSYFAAEEPMPWGDAAGPLLVGAVVLGAGAWIYSRVAQG